jgi:hypothetical protein
MLLLAIIGGAAIGALTNSKGIGLTAGAAFILLALLYLNRKEDRSKFHGLLELELATLPPDEQAYWKPVLDNPEQLSEKIQERVPNLQDWLSLAA